MNSEEGFEIDYIAVGDGERSGDGIAIRYGKLLSGDSNSQVVIVIDGGTKESAQELISRVRNEYGTNKINYLISTHPDADHLSGLKEILTELDIDNLYIHIPWNHVQEIQNNFSQNFSLNNLADKLQDEFELVNEVVGTALEKGVSIEEPFEGLTVNGQMLFLGPSKNYYEELLCRSEKTPDLKSALQEVLGQAQLTVRKAAEWVEDRFDIQILEENPITSAENNTSVILLLLLNGKKALLTGDAGVEALNYASDYANTRGISLLDLNFFHVPHHGSKHNLNNKILEKINAETAFISAARQSDKHPSQRIINALIKNGFSVHKTCGRHIRHQENAPDRIGWTNLIPESFSHLFKEE